MNALYEISILGIGNTLMSDDGLGVRAAEALCKKIDNPDIFIADAGTSIISYLTEISSSYSIIIVDALCCGNKPGTIYELEMVDDALLTLPASSHSLSLAAIFHQARMLTSLPVNIIIYGIEPHNLNFGSTLSPSIENALPKVVHLIMRRIENLLFDADHTQK